MKKQEAKKRIQDLRKLIEDYDQHYFQKNDPIISDYAYDQLTAELKDLEKKSPNYQAKDSPTQTVTDYKGNTKQIYHNPPMQSLGNTYSKEDVRAFVNRIQKILDKPEEKITFFCELKFDGIAVNLVYEAGKLVNAITRGDGIKGDDITQHVQYIEEIPKRVVAKDLPERFEVRGELMISKKNFKAINEERKRTGKKLFANSRNAAGGTLQLLDPSLSRERKLNAHVYALYMKEGGLKTHEEGIKVLEKWGFPISKTYQKSKNIQEVMQYAKVWESQQDQLPVEIDGIVIKVNSLADQKQLGTTSKHPRWAIAYKYSSPVITTVLKSIQYQVGKTGAITPIAELHPVLLDGSIIKKASLYNIPFMERLGLHEKDVLVITKGGEIIPKVLEVIKEQRKVLSKRIKPIQHCPSCGEKLSLQALEAVSYCRNHKKCMAQIEARVIHFVHKRAMEITLLGKSTLQTFMKKKLVHTPADIYKLKQEDIVALEGFQEKSASNIIQNIQNSKTVSFERVLFALNIPYVGENLAKLLARKLGDIEVMMKATKKDLLSIEGVGEKVAESIRNYFTDSDHQLLIKELKEIGLQFATTKPREKAFTDQKLKNKQFVISGTLSEKRDNVKLFIENHGGKVINKLSKKTDYLLMGEKPSKNKQDQAEKLGTTKISEEELRKML